MASIVCTVCEGSGKVKIGWFRKKDCSTCKGSSYVNQLTTPVRQSTQSSTPLDGEDNVLDFTRTDNLSSRASVRREM